MLGTLILLFCSAASSLPHGKLQEQYSLHDIYTDSLMLARQMHEDVRILLPPYEEHLGIRNSHEPSFCMKDLPSCTFNYSDWRSIEDTSRLQQNSQYLRLFSHHINASCSSRLRLRTECNQALEMLQHNIRDLQDQITQQLELLEQPTVYAAALSPPPLCTSESEWVGYMEGYMVLRGLEKCMQKMVRDFTLLRSQQQ